ncbi:protein FAM200C-like [Palaemon carinicauda]|uniref:protein FAM200C-like n=1 Tax=Palaemon carinicauda TaxID=392227 RepID=UPI0035B63589
MAEIICGPNQADRFKWVPLSNNTIKRRIDKLPNDIKDQLIPLEREIEEETTKKDVDELKKVDAFLNEPDGQLDWVNCTGVSTDGAPSMLGVNSGFLSHVKKENPSVIATHSIIHHQALVVKLLQPDLEVMCDIMKIVNYIKSSALNSKLFSSLCGNIDSEHHCLLFYAPI